MTPTTPGICCLIPFYNEGDRLLAVLQAVAQVPGLDHILCIDDGSQDDAGPQVACRYPQVKVLRLPRNGGKTAAIAHGLRHVRHEWVLLLDADLQGLQPAEVVQALDTVRRRPELDMLILRRLNAPWLVRQTRGDVLLSGDRLVRRRHLAAVLTGGRVSGFQLEVALNAYLQTRDAHVAWLPWSATNVPKHTKRGTAAGLAGDAAMYAELLRCVGVRAYARQLRTFARQGA